MAENIGKVTQVIGPVVDVEFPPNQLPEINNALKVDVTLGDRTVTITCEGKSGATLVTVP